MSILKFGLHKVFKCTVFYFLLLRIDTLKSININRLGVLLLQSHKNKEQRHAKHRIERNYVCGLHHVENTDAGKCLEMRPEG